MLLYWWHLEMCNFIHALDEAASWYQQTWHNVVLWSCDPRWCDIPRRQNSREKARPPLATVFSCFLKWPEMFSWFLRVAQTEELPSGLWGLPRLSCFTHGCVVSGQGLGRCFSFCFPVRTLWSALLRDLLSAWRPVPVCVLQEVAGLFFHGECI